MRNPCKAGIVKSIINLAQTQYIIYIIKPKQNTYRTATADNKKEIPTLDQLNHFDNL